MRLDDSNDLLVEDQRGGGFGGSPFGGGFGSGGGGLGGIGFALLPLLFSRLGCFGTAIVLGLLFLFGGGLSLFGGGGQGVSSSGYSSPAPTATGASSVAAACSANPASRFSCNAMANVNATWAQILPSYTRPKLVFYSRAGQSGCGAAQSAMGPFYCPSDRGVYLDTGFFDELRDRFQAPGDFAQAYVIAHEVGHHVQNLLGTSDQVARAQGATGRAGANALSVRLELQADCFAGVWAAHNRDRLDPGDVEEGMRAAAAIGDDTLQQEAGRRPMPDSFTHGTSAQRQYWLKRGLDSGDPRQCDTFNGAGAGAA